MLPEQAAPCCGIELIDYGSSRGNSVLLGSGCGLMMAVMDAQLEFRWCADLDRGGHALDFAILIGKDVSMIGLVGWFSISEPKAFLQIIAEPLACPVVAYGGNVDLGCADLQTFLQMCQQCVVGMKEAQLAADGKSRDLPHVLEHPSELSGQRFAEGALGIRLGARTHVD